MNKKILIAGGSRGIGRTMAVAFLKDGDKVFLLSRDSKELESTQKELSSLGEVQVAVCDVSKEADVEAVAEKVKKVWGGLDILINAAGIYGPIGPVYENDPKEWRKVIDVNLIGTFLMTRAMVPLLRTSKRGKIMNFVGGGEGAYENFSGYVSSKGAIMRFNETVAEELKSLNIDVNAIAPGPVNTKFLDVALEAGAEKTGKANYERLLKQKDTGGVPPERAADLALFLASDKSDGITGKILSAVWDNYLKLPDHLKELMTSDVYTARRVKPEHRGMKFD